MRVYDVALSDSEVFRPTPNGVGSTAHPPHAEESEADSGPAAWLNSSLLGRCGFWLRRLPLRLHDPRPAGAGEPDVPAFPSTIQFPAPQGWGREIITTIVSRLLTAVRYLLGR